MQKKKFSPDKRHSARLAAIQYLFTYEVAKRIGLNLEVFEPQSLLSYLEITSFDTVLYENIIEGVEKNLQSIDERIQEKATAWPIEQINIVDLIILRCAIWEGLYYKQAPPKVIINEAIELGKELSSEKSSAFINGVLANLIPVNQT